jgi:hypothetical protein
LIETLGEGMVRVLNTTSFVVMAFALLVGGFIILKGLWQGRRVEQRLIAKEALEQRKA